MLVIRGSVPNAARPKVGSSASHSSPSLWWDDGVILKAEAARAESRKPLSSRVFLSVGSAEGNKEMVDPLKALTTALASRAYPDLRLETHIFDGGDHLSGIELVLLLPPCGRAYRNLIPRATVFAVQQRKLP